MKKRIDAISINPQVVDEPDSLHDLIRFLYFLIRKVKQPKDGKC